MCEAGNASPSVSSVPIENGMTVPLEVRRVKLLTCPPVVSSAITTPVADVLAAAQPDSATAIASTATIASLGRARRRLSDRGILALPWSVICAHGSGPRTNGRVGLLRSPP